MSGGSQPNRNSSVSTGPRSCEFPTVDKSLAAPVGWLWLRSGAGDPAFNMALDEALLEQTLRFQRPILRFYGWTEPAASFGYFQRYQEVEQLMPLRPLVRRPTGGGIVPHDADWTYSLAFPRGHEWYELSATESYCRVHRWIQMAFEKLGFQTELAPESFTPQPGQCFAGHEQSDLLWRGRKIAGAAQRRRKDGLLIQGSIQPPSPSILRLDWETSMLEVARQAHAAHWDQCPPDSVLEQRARELARSKYSQSSYNQRR
jgi:hypothetical protein